MVVFLFLIIAVALVVQYFSLKFPIHQLHYRLEPSKRSVEQGEEFTMTTIIDNASKHRIPFLRAEEQIPNAVLLNGAENMELRPLSDANVHTSTLFLKKKQKVTRTISGAIYKRGIYHFRYARLHIGDFLGIKELDADFKQERSIVAYPRRLHDKKLDLVISDILGEISVRSFLHQDPMLVMGYRDYTGCEPLKSISFPVSAKRNQLTVKEFDHTREELVDIIFDVSYKGEFNHYFDQLEAMFCMVRTICEAFEKKGVSYRLITNAFYASMEIRGVNVIRSGGSGGKSFHKILEMLGMASNAAMCKTEELLTHVFRGFEQEKEFVYVSQMRDADTQDLIKDLEGRYGKNLHTIYGEDFEQSYMDLISENEREEKAC